MRVYHAKAINGSAAHSASIIEHSRTTNPTALATPSEVMAWLKVFTLPERLAA